MKHRIFVHRRMLRSPCTPEHGLPKMHTSGKQELVQSRAGRGAASSSSVAHGREDV